MKRWISLISAGVLLGGLLWTSIIPASAHGHTQVGDYDVVIGFHNEPAYQGMPNGLDLFVTNTKTNQKVNGLEKTLKAEIIFGSHKKEVTLQPQEDQDGAYIAYMIPTDVGDYTWHVFGMIENTPLDVSMTSSPTTFDSVAAQSDDQFPSVDPNPAELAAQAAAASRTAQIALIVGAAGVVLGAAGLWFGWRRMQGG